MMNKYIFGYENWKKIYSSSLENKKKTWIFLKTSDDKEIYLREYSDWLSIQEYIISNSVTIKSIGLRYKSNYIDVDTSSADGVYLIKSAKGEFGGKTKQCITIGRLFGNKVEKIMWLTPELIEEGSYTDDIEECFLEAVVYNDKEKRKAEAI